MYNRNKMIIQLVTFLVLLQYSAAQIGCPAINCPANCDVIRGPNGCNHCACSKANGEQNVCSAVPSCPKGCSQDKGEDGCPVCQCGHNGIFCAAVPSCLKGCLNHNNVTGCYTCTCSPSPLPGSLEIGSTGASVNSRQRRQLRQFPPLRRGRPNFTPGGVQFRATQLPFRNRRPTFSSGSFNVAGSRCQSVNCQQGCRSVIDLYGCRECICGLDNVFCPSVPACYGQCLRNNPNTGCSECTCSLEGISSHRNQASTHNSVAQQNGANILSSASVLHQNANIPPNQHATQPNGRPLSTIGFNIPTNSNAFHQQPTYNTHSRPTSNTNFIPRGPALNHAVNVKENVPLGQYAPTHSHVPAVQQGFANPGTQQQGISNLHLSHFQPGPSIQHTLPNHHVATNTGSVQLTSPIGNPVPIPQNQHLSNSVPLQGIHIHSTPGHHSSAIQHALPNQHVATNTGSVPLTSPIGNLVPIPQNHHLGNSVPLQGINIHSTPGHHSSAIQHALPNQHLPTNTGLISGASSDQIQVTLSENPVHTQHVAPVGHLNPTNHALVPNQHVHANSAFFSMTTSSQIPLIPLGDPAPIQPTHHFQNSVPLETINVDPFPIQLNPTTSIALNPGKTFNRIPSKHSGGPDPMWKIPKDENFVPVKHLTHANPLIQVSIFSPTNNPVGVIPEKNPKPFKAKEPAQAIYPNKPKAHPNPAVLSHQQESLPPKILPQPEGTPLPEPSYPALPPHAQEPFPHDPFPSKVLHRPEPTPQPEPTHPDMPTNPQKPFPPKILSQPELKPQPELLHQEMPPHPQEPFPPNVLPQSEWTAQPEPPHPVKPPQPQKPFSPIVLSQAELAPGPKQPHQEKPPHPREPFPLKAPTKPQLTPQPDPPQPQNPFPPKAPPQPDMTPQPHNPEKPAHPLEPSQTKETLPEGWQPQQKIPPISKLPKPEDPYTSESTAKYEQNLLSNKPEKSTTIKPTTKQPFAPPSYPKPINPPHGTPKGPYKPDEIPSTTVKPFVPPKDPKPTTKEPYKPVIIPSTTVKPFVPPKDPKPTHPPQGTTKDPYKPDENPSPTLPPFVPPKDPKPTSPSQGTIKDPYKPHAKPSPTVPTFVPPKDPKPTHPSQGTTKDPYMPDEKPSPTVKPFVPSANPKPINPSQGTTTTAPLIPTSSTESAPVTAGENNPGKWVWVD